MKIENSQIQMSSKRQYNELHQREESLRAWVGEPRPDFETIERGAATGLSRAALGARNSVELSERALALSEDMKNAIKDLQEVDIESEMVDDEAALNLQVEVEVFRLMFEQFTGRRINVMSPKDLEGAGFDTPEEPLEPKIDTPDVAEDTSVGWGIEYDLYEKRVESEQTSFKAQGVIRTADNEEVHFDVELLMSRHFMEEHRIQVRAGDAELKDPLVVNFGGNAAQLTSTKFSFDIDADGKKDQISFLKPGSGFLALDRNGDGKINDGSELFGALTGDGFRELAAYDEDGNNWIDSSDSIYEKLRIWYRDESGKSHLVGLGEKGIGAIYLGHVDTEFSLRDSSNTKHGQVASTGLYLRNDLSVGTVQKIDLTV